jgi:hypothetical protein
VNEDLPAALQRPVDKDQCLFDAEFDLELGVVPHLQLVVAECLVAAEKVLALVRR